MSPSFEKIEDEDETESPNQLLGSCQGTFITLWFSLFNRSIINYSLFTNNNLEEKHAYAYIQIV